MTAPRSLPPVRSLWWLTVVIVLTAGMLRAPFVAVAPVAGDIGADLGVGAGTVGLLTSIPILCFAVCTPFAVGIIRRGGPDFALTLAMAGAVVGCIVRSSGGIAAAVAGTAILGAFLTIGNVVVPILVAREYDTRRAHTMTGVYTSAFNVGTMTVTLATAPLAAQVGWRTAILVWAAFGLGAVAVWIPLRGLRLALVPRRGPRPSRESDAPSAARDAATWLLAAAFAGQAFAFYSATAWLPTILGDQGFTAAAAGAIAAIFQVAGIAGSLLLPQLTTRTSLRLAVTCTGLAWLTVPLGFLLAPAGWFAWCAIGGVAQGAGITLVFIMINAFRDDQHTTAGRSGIVQGVGYAVAGLGPLLLGALHEWTATWVWPLLLVLAATLLFLGAGVVVARMLDGRARVG
ncbi:CynX/NimT family MFS transporter [Microbacterium fluvii]|uniref:CynX/NimT family MFS transporter n=1 Tax=Microbacterium fluvii TaxID=415215 RepID=A0ABW2HDU4_9MICO|nr:MFS transporter [Microbacterium fluvii]MCU4672878.1 MFS transporter [Microbacterium fluvii]